MEKVRLGIIGIGGMGTNHARSILEGKVPNMVLTAVSGTRPERLSFAEKELSKDFGIIRRGDSPGIRRCEVVPKGHSKATGMQFCLERLGIDHKNSYAFGDSANDLPMLEFAAHSAAMGGCPDTLKSTVDFVTDTFYNDGLAKAIERFGLI